MSESLIDVQDYVHVNHLWPLLVERLGLEKSQQAVKQALDLQRMAGNKSTLPVLFSETCGIALADIQFLRHQTGLACNGERMVLLVNPREKIMQLIQLN
ncbi:MAG: hypothetical protein AB8B70_07755 [Prochlorococcus sp.]